MLPGDSEAGLFGCFQNDCGSARNRIGNGSEKRNNNYKCIFIFSRYMSYSPHLSVKDVISHFDFC